VPPRLRYAATLQAAHHLEPWVLPLPAGRRAPDTGRGGVLSLVLALCSGAFSPAHAHAAPIPAAAPLAGHPGEPAAGIAGKQDDGSTPEPGAPATTAGGARAAGTPESDPTSPRTRGAVEFDTATLTQRGLDPQIASYFRDSARFRPGGATVTVFVNDIHRGRTQARFNDQGELCFDLALLETAGLKIPETMRGDRGGPDAGACRDYRTAYPGTIVSLRPNQEEIRLIVPTDALRPTESDFSGYSRGGTAVLLNYDLTAMRSESGGTTSHFLSLGSELGLNVNDWILRSRASTSMQAGQLRTQHLYAYAQRTWADRGATVQAGQINIANSVLTGAPLTGVQVFPDAALAAQARNVVMVEGLAQSPQARVEVRQAGALIYSTVVPAGPFTLTDLPLLNGSSDLDVTVIETGGAQHRFTVPGSAINAGSLGQRPGYSFALGKSRDLGSGNARQLWVASASGNWTAGRHGHLGAGALVASRYQAVSWGADIRPSRTLGLKLQQRVSRATREASRTGTQIEFSGVASKLPGNLSLSFSTAVQSKGYRSLTDVTQNIVDAAASTARYRTQHTASLGWSGTRAGNVAVGYSHSTLQNGRKTQRLNMSWAKTFSVGTLSLNVERDLNSRNDAGSGYAGNTPVNAYYASLSIPLGKRSVRTYASNSGGYTRMGAAYSERVGDSLNYSVNAERNTQSGNNNVSAQLSAVPRFAQVNLGVSAAGKGARSYYGGASGGLVLHAKGLTASPYPVQDTFGIVSTGTADIKVTTPQGPVWTDHWGRAVIPQLSAYGRSQVEINTRSLPRNVDIRNGVRQVAAGRGSVNHVDFELTRVRRLMLNARDADGNALPAGAYVFDEKQQFVSTVLGDGRIFLNNGAENTTLSVALPDGGQCALRYTLPVASGSGRGLFETVDASCAPRQD
jgi:outer membrane usher protein FimD/PapC